MTEIRLMSAPARKPRFAKLGELMSPGRFTAAQPARRQAAGTARTNSSARPLTLAEARAQAISQERQRLKAVFASDAAKGREHLAAQLLITTGMKADRIIAMLPRFNRAAVKDAQTEIGKIASNLAEPATRSKRKDNHGWAAVHAKLRNERTS